MKLNQQGQALVEWAIFSVGVFMLWTSAMTAARYLLERTSAQSWSVIAARQALSNAATLRPQGMILKKRAGMRRGEASARFGHASEAYEIRVPGTNQDFSLFNSFSFGYPSSPSSE